MKGILVWLPAFLVSVISGLLIWLLGHLVQHIEAKKQKEDNKAERIKELEHGKDLLEFSEVEKALVDNLLYRISEEQRKNMRLEDDIETLKKKIAASKS